MDRDRQMRRVTTPSVLEEGEEYQDYKLSMRAQRQRLVRKWEWLLKDNSEYGLEEIPHHLWEPMAALFENQQNFTRSKTEATMTTDVVFPIRFALPIVRNVYPNLIATKIASIQPMPLTSGGVGRVFYQDFLREDAGDSSLTDLDSDYALSEENAVPKRVKMTITSETITAIKDILGASWSTEVMEDIGGAMGIDVEAELVQQMSDEIIREIDQRVLNEILNGAGSGNTNWSQTAAAGYLAKEWYETLFHAIIDAEDNIYANRYREADFLVCGRDAYKFLLKSGDFKPEPRLSDKKQRMQSVGVKFEGSYMGMWDVYRTVMINTAKIIVGYYPRSTTDTGYVYAPYIPLAAMPLVYAEYKAYDDATMPGAYVNTDKWSRNVRTRYGKKMVVPEAYATVTITA